jgi:integrase
MKKPPRQRAKKGTVTIKQRGECLQLRWSVDGKAFSLSLGLNTPLNMHNARDVAVQIERDIDNRIFDPTLGKYRPKPQVQTEDSCIASTLELFTQFIQSRRKSGTSGQTITAKYKPLLNNLERFGRNVETNGDAREFIEILRSRQSATVANQNLSLLRNFGAWCVQQQAIESNPFNDIKPLKEHKAVSPTRKPFSRDEVTKLLETAKTHPSLYKWHDFCMVLLYLGLRPSEAIGLLWRDVDLVRGEITICESLARDEDGRSSGSSRVRKPTKNYISRTLGLPGSLLTMLQGRAGVTRRKPDELIFLSPKGYPIDDHSFSQKIWKPLCKAANVPHRVPYACRHTVISHGIESGRMTLQQAQYTAGHTDTRMVTETYGHMLNKPNLIDWQED